MKTHLSSGYLGLESLYTGERCLYLGLYGERERDLRCLNDGGDRCLERDLERDLE